MKSRSASEIADALECYRMKSERQRKNCKNKSCHYNNADPHYGCWCCSNSILHDAVAILKEQKEKAGKWIPVTNGRGGMECSICHDYAPSYQNGTECLSTYCPNCGAKMEGR